MSIGQRPGIPEGFPDPGLVFVQLGMSSCPKSGDASSHRMTALTSCNS